jgi:homoserine dehydrogenase
MSGCSLVVLKFGSSVLRNEADLPRVADEIAGHVAAGRRVLAVVSAIGSGTDELAGRADTVARGIERESPAAQAAYAALLGTGEAVSAALVGLALDRRGLDFTILDVGRVGPFTRGPQLDAQPHALDTSGIKRTLAERPVAILPGFVGRDAYGRHTLLGRGGSDLTALFVAHTLRAEHCRLLKDVDGIYEHDPALSSLAKARRFAALDWDGALRLQDAILQHKAAQYAFRHRVVFEVGACGGKAGTLVGAAESRFAPPSPAARCRTIAAEGRLAS